MSDSPTNWSAPCPNCGQHGLHNCAGIPQWNPPQWNPPPTDWNRAITALEKLVNLLEKVLLKEELK